MLSIKKLLVMNFKSLVLLIISTCIFQLSAAQKPEEWNGKKCAVVLTYDDALNVHLDKVIPCLDSAGIRGTFYLIGESQVVNDRITEWRKAAMEGHELGNHSLTHPCDGRLTGRSWVSPGNDLSKYSVDRADKEIRVTNTLLQAIDGKKERTYASPCGEFNIDTMNYYTALEHDFVCARGTLEGLQYLNNIDLNNIKCFGINGQSGDYMIDLVKKASESHALLVFLFHGVGGEHNINVSLEAHSQLIRYLKQHQNEIWIAPMVEVGLFVRKNQGNN
jgi:peptidoglycan/xylan/chitin deacetylase (PgdA/CDA1 family)